jgi:hypothetical protein
MAQTPLIDRHRVAELDLDSCHLLAVAALIQLDGPWSPAHPVGEPVPSRRPGPRPPRLGERPGTSRGPVHHPDPAPTPGPSPHRPRPRVLVPTRSVLPRRPAPDRRQPGPIVNDDRHS